MPKAGSIFRLPFLIPYALSGTAIATVWQFMLMRDGALNSMLRPSGLGSLTRSWLLATSPQHLRDDLRVNLAGSRGERPALFHRVAGHSDRADPGGADRRRRWVATLQGHDLADVAPMTIVVVGISLVNSLKTFDIVWIMTQGGPYRSSGNPGRHDVPGNVRPLPVRLRRGDRGLPERDRVCGVDLLFDRTLRNT